MQAAAKSWFAGISRSLGVFAAAVFTISATLPLLIHFHQAEEFKFAAVDVLMVGVAVTAALTLAAALVLAALPFLRAPVRHVSAIALVAILAVAFLFPIQSGPIVTGDETVEMSAAEAALSVLPYIVLLAATAMAAIFFQSLMQALTFAAISVSVGFAGFAAATGGPSQLLTNEEEPVAIDQFSALSPERNIIVVLFDELKGKITDEILSADSELRRHFEGFTLFPDASSTAPRTAVGLPSILSGRRYIADEVISKRTHRSIDDGILTDADAAGHRPFYIQGIYSKCGPAVCARAEALGGEPAWSQLAKQYARILDVGLLRITPLTLHESVKGAVETASAAYFPASGWPIEHLNAYRTVVANLTVSDDPSPRLWFYHFKWTHRPLSFDENCDYHFHTVNRRPLSPYVRDNHVRHGRCALTEFTNLLTRLKELKVYDNSAILLISDHGDNLIHHVSYTPKTYEQSYIPGEEEQYRPTIMIKPFAADGPLQVNPAPAELLDVRPTLCELLEGCRNDGDGVSLWALPPNFQRERQIVQYRHERGWTNEEGRIVDYRIVSLTGTMDELPWAMFNPPAYALGERLDFREEGNARAYTFLGWTLPEKEGTYTDARSGNPAMMALPIKSDLPPALRLTAKVSGYGEPKTVTVAVGDHPVAEWSIAGSEPHELHACIPAYLVDAARRLDLRFHIGTPELASGRNDERQLGVRFAELTVTAAEEAAGRSTVSLAPQVVGSVQAGEACPG